MGDTTMLFTRSVRVRYPSGRGRIVLRTELDWDRDVPAATVDDAGVTWTFELAARRPFLYFKPCLVTPSGTSWAVGANQLLLMTHHHSRDVYPIFSSPDRGSFSELLDFDSTILGRRHRLRVYLPPGYFENTLKKYPVLYVQDGGNLFFPDEAFAGQPWGMDRSLDLLDTMNAVDKVVVVGIYSGDRMAEYTLPGYQHYGRSLVEEIIPAAESKLRLLGTPRATGVMGSSLGGVVSFFMAWQWPEELGVAICMSSTFSYRDDLIGRVLNEPKRAVKIYLDSGWPGDNYEVNLAMALALAERGWVPGRDYVYLSFPLQRHHERAWGERLHLPLQLFWGRVGVAYRERHA